MIVGFGLSLPMTDSTPQSSQAHAQEHTNLEALIAIAVGNTRTRIGSFLRTEVTFSASIDSADTAGIIAMIKDRQAAFEGTADPAVVIGGVDPQTIDAIEAGFPAGTVSRLGRDIEINIKHTLTGSGEKTVGQDRLLCALGAYYLYKQACVVVDAGTAMTVDFIDGTGVFHGGAIMPGTKMMLDSMHENAAALPQVVFAKIDPASHDPGKQTDDAMVLGVTAGVCGAVRWLTERYAEFFEGYPKVIATGGDMGILEDDELIEAFVPDLQLIGIRIACEKALADETDDEADDDA